MKSIRVPAGVTIDGKGWGGRFVSRDQLISLAAATEGRGLRAIERLAEREYSKAATSHQRAADKYMDAPERWRERRELAQQHQQEWERVRDAVEDFQETTPEAAPRPKAARRKGRGTVRGPVGRAGARGAKAKSTTRASGTAGRQGAGRGGKRGTQTAKPLRPAVKKGPVSVEWEIGFKYRTTRRGRRGSDVDVNLRIRRVDGRAFGVVAARRVLAHVRRTQETPDHYMVAGVDWKRPHAGSGWRHGDVSDLDNFWAPMYSRDRDTSAWRFGAVKLGMGESGDDDDE